MVGAENPAAYPLERCTMLAAVAAKICKRSNGMLHDENNHIFRHWIKKFLSMCSRSTTYQTYYFQMKARKVFFFFFAGHPLLDTTFSSYHK